MSRHISHYSFPIRQKLLQSAILILLVPKLCLSQTKKTQLELALMATYSQFYFNTRSMPHNDVGACVAMYFYTRKEERRRAVRWGLELQQTRFNIDSARSTNGYSKNIRFSLHQLRIPLYFPVAVAKFRSSEIFIEPGVFASIPLPGIGHEDFYQYNYYTSSVSGPKRVSGSFMQQPDVGAHFGLGITRKTSLGELTIRGDYCFGTLIFGRLTISEGTTAETHLITTPAIRVGAILRLKKVITKIQ